MSFKANEYFLVKLLKFVKSAEPPHKNTFGPYILHSAIVKILKEWA